MTAASSHSVNPLSFTNSSDRYGLVHVAIHWLMALAIVSTFCLGLWMVKLDYYDSWYNKGPDLHRSIGVLIVSTMLLRLVWRLANTRPKPLLTHSPLERFAASIAHWSMYVLIILIASTGYLISTADGRSVRVFDWFEIPATITSIEDQEDVAGNIHLYLAVTLISVAALHALAALKHHFVDKDATLRRMLGLKQ